MVVDGNHFTIPVKTGSSTIICGFALVLLLGRRNPKVGVVQKATKHLLPQLRRINIAQF